MDAVHIDGADLQLGFNDAGLARMQEACRCIGSNRCCQDRLDRERVAQSGPEPPTEALASPQLAELAGSPAIELGGAVTDLDGTTWVTAPGDDSVRLFPLTPQPPETMCSQEVDLSRELVWTFEGHPDVGLAWTLPPVFFQGGDCLRTWPAIRDTNEDVVVPSRAVGFDRHGEENSNCWGIDRLRLEHDLMGYDGNEILELTGTQLSLSQASGTAISQLDLEPWTVHNYGGCTQWGDLSRESDSSWRIGIFDESEADGTGHDGSYFTSFDIRIEPSGLQVVGSTFYEEDTYDPEEITDRVARDMVGWSPHVAPDDSVCFLGLDDSRPVADQDRYELENNRRGGVRRHIYTIGTNRLVAEVLDRTHSSTDVLWPNTACGVRTERSSRQTRWILETDSGQRQIADSANRSSSTRGLDFVSSRRRPLNPPSDEIHDIEHPEVHSDPTPVREVEIGSNAPDNGCVTLQLTSDTVEICQQLVETDDGGSATSTQTIQVGDGATEVLGTSTGPCDLTCELRTLAGVDVLDIGLEQPALALRWSDEHQDFANYGEGECEYVITMSTLQLRLVTGSGWVPIFEAQVGLDRDHHGEPPICPPEFERRRGQTLGLSPRSSGPVELVLTPSDGSGNVSQFSYDATHQRYVRRETPAEDIAP